MATDHMIEQLSFERGWLVEAVDHDSGEVTYDLAFPAAPGTSRLLSDMLSDLATQCRDNGAYIEVHLVVTMREGLQVRDGIKTYVEEPLPL